MYCGRFFGLPSDGVSPLSVTGAPLEADELAEQDKELRRLLWKTDAPLGCGQVRGMFCSIQYLRFAGEDGLHRS